MNEFFKLVHTINRTDGLYPTAGSQNCSPNSHRKPRRNVLRVSEVCLEILRDSKNYFGFVLDKLSELVNTEIVTFSKFLCDHTTWHGLK